MKNARILIGVLILILSGLGGVLCNPVAHAATTVPQKMVYNGHLLNASGVAITTEHNVRFSFWTSTDYATGDVDGAGAINIGAATYAGWQEVHTVTPNSDGYFTVELGSSTALLDFSALSTDTIMNLHLQVEVKEGSAAATAYELLDRDASDDAVDRAPLLSVPFALNANLLDGRDTGTGSGSIPVLQTGGLLPLSMIPAGTNQDSFVLDADDSTATGSIVLQFGDSLSKTISFDVDAGVFRMNDDLTLTDSAGLTASGALATESGMVLNMKNAAQDAVLVFGNSVGQQTLKFVHDTQQFEFSDNVHVTGGLTASGTLKVEGGVQVGSYAPESGTGAGTLRWTGSDIEAYDGNGWTSVTQGAKFIGVTSSSTTGAFSTGSLVGYQAANDLCADQYAGSHYCQMDEVISTINQSLDSFSGISNAWAAEGAPGYTSDSNDCRGWTSANGSYLGAWWEFSTDGGSTIASGGGQGYLTNCAVSQPIACCR